MILDKRTPLAKAKELFAKGDPDSFRYCCLNLRDCIEMICYERLEQHRKELPEEVFVRWKPQQIVELITQCDPDALGDRIMRIREEKPDGRLGNAIFETTVKGISRGLLRHYQRLGSYLHLPPPNVLFKGETPDIIERKSSLQEIIQEIEKYIASPTLMNIAMFVDFKCSYCGALNVKNKKVLSEGSKVTCTGKDCKALYVVRGLNSDALQFDPVEVEWRCACAAPNFLGIHQFSCGRKVECCDCKNPVEITYSLKPLDSEDIRNG